MQNVLKLGAAAVLLAAAGACATRPAPEPVITEAPPEPEPVIEETVTAPVGEVAASVLPGSVQDFVQNVGEYVYFDLDQYRLDDQDQQILRRQAAWLQAYPNVRVLVAGNCDERGTREYNLALGERRANAVKQFLVSQGVSASRIDTVSYGKERPKAMGSNEQAWALNRNSHTQIISGATS